MQVKKQQLEPDMEQRTGSKLGKEYIKAVYCHPAYLTYMQSTSCEMLGLDEAQAGINNARRNINNLRYTEELHKKDLHDPDNHNGVITHLGPHVLESEVKWALGKHHYKQS